MNTIKALVLLVASTAMFASGCVLQAESCIAGDSIECGCADRVSIQNCDASGEWGACRCSNPATGCGRYPATDAECPRDRPFFWNCADGERVPLGCDALLASGVCCPYNG